MADLPPSGAALLERVRGALAHGELHDEGWTRCDRAARDVVAELGRLPSLDLHDALLVAERAMEDKRLALRPPGSPVAVFKATREEVRALDASRNRLRALRALL